MSRLASPSALTALALVLAVPSLQAQEPQPEQGLSAEITVFEAQVTLDAGDLSFRDRQKLRPDQVLVLEGGAPRRVTNLVPLGSGGWRILIYVDAPLSRARTVRLASLRLGEAARQLTELGTVELVVADPEPRSVFGPTREPVPLAEQLTKLAASGIGGDQIQGLRSAYGELGPSLPVDDPRRAEALAREVALVRARVDHLLLRAAQGCDGEPCALFLVSDGFVEEPADFYLGERRLEDEAAARPSQEASRELAQTVTAYDWMVFPLPLREDRLEAPLVARTTTDFDAFLDHTGAIRPAPKRSDKEPVLDLEALEVSVTPVLQPLLRLAVASTGGVVRIADDLDEPIGALPDRRRVYYLTDRPLDGDARPVSARLSDGAARLATPSWVRSSTPAAVAGARVRGFLAGGANRGDAALRATIERGAGGAAELVLEADWGAAAELTAKSVVRVSVGYARAGDLPWVGHQRIAASPVDADGTWRHRLALRLPDGVERVAVVAEALLPRAWGATLLETGP